MTIRRLIYISRVARSVRFADAEAIAAAAAVRNHAAQLTGVLLYTPSHFLQVLEGEPQALQDTVARIRLDARHSDLRVVEDCTATTREFGAWAMAARYCSAPAAEFEGMDASRALELLRTARDERDGA